MHDVQLAKLTWSRVGDGGCRHGDGNASTAAAAVLPTAATPAASTEGGDRQKRKRTSFYSGQPAQTAEQVNTADKRTALHMCYCPI